MRFSTISLMVLLASVAPGFSAESDSVTPNAVIREMNSARENPVAYAAYLEDLRSHFNGRYLVLPGQTKIFTREGLGAVDDAIHFLHSVKPVQPLTLSPGMCKGAADHCAEQAGGAIGHGGGGLFGSNPAGRMKRYGTWTAAWGENISYGKTSARDVVLALIIDDGLPGRKHRKNIFNPNFNYAGAGFGPHARYRTVCSIDFAGGYFERGQSSTQTLVARNF